MEYATHFFINDIYVDIAFNRYLGVGIYHQINTNRVMTNKRFLKK